jgi:hypothetical protein
VTIVRFLILSCVALPLLAAQPAAALSPELVSKCRELAAEKNPPTEQGRIGSIQPEREYFRRCLANDGDMPDVAKPPNNATPSNQDQTTEGRSPPNRQ